MCFADGRLSRCIRENGWDCGTLPAVSCMFFFFFFFRGGESTFVMLGMGWSR